MEKVFPQGSREAILGFHLTDRLKAELQLASSLLQSLREMSGSEELGARRLYMEFLRSLDQDITLCQTIISESEMVRLQTVFTGLRGLVAEGQLADIQTNLTWMISIMTTYAQRAMEYLLKEKLL
ncbi:MAG: hypothetical protein ACUVRZ_05720 [Desulfobacca sp.]|uniref:hypothetical protein n=1 Tax=Desulfobacca sp. TaxID=2067990 RepID=UPI0040498049